MVDSVVLDRIQSVVRHIVLRRDHFVLLLHDLSYALAVDLDTKLAKYLSRKIRQTVAL